MSGSPPSSSTISTDVGEDSQDQAARVRASYNVLSRAYRADHADEATQRQYAGWLDLVRDRAPAGGDVLDLGCGEVDFGGHTLFVATRND